LLVGVFHAETFNDLTKQELSEKLLHCMFKDRCISSADFESIFDQNWSGKEFFCPSEIEKVVEQLILRYIEQNEELKSAEV
jgi:hypothetical protein